MVKNRNTLSRERRKKIEEFQRKLFERVSRTQNRLFQPINNWLFGFSLTNDGRLKDTVKNISRAAQVFRITQDIIDRDVLGIGVWIARRSEDQYRSNILQRISNILHTDVNHIYFI